jgi:hypothetical protein
MMGFDISTRRFALRMMGDKAISPSGVVFVPAGEWFWVVEHENPAAAVVTVCARRESKGMPFGVLTFPAREDAADYAALILGGRLTPDSWHFVPTSRFETVAVKPRWGWEKAW